MKKKIYKFHSEESRSFNDIIKTPTFEIAELYSSSSSESSKLESSDGSTNIDSVYR